MHWPLTPTLTIPLTPALAPTLQALRLGDDMDLVSVAEFKAAFETVHVTVRREVRDATGTSLASLGMARMTELVHEIAMKHQPRAVGKRGRERPARPVVSTSTPRGGKQPPGGNGSRRSAC